MQYPTCDTETATKDIRLNKENLNKVETSVNNNEPIFFSLLRAICHSNKMFFFKGEVRCRIYEKHSVLCFQCKSKTLFKKESIKNISRKLKMKTIIFPQYLSIVLVKNKVLFLPHLFYLDTSVLHFLTQDLPPTISYINFLLFPNNPLQNLVA